MNIKTGELAHPDVIALLQGHHKDMLQHNITRLLSSHT
jgi:hypothetical protein